MDQTTSETLDFETAKRLARSPDPATRKRVAADRAMRPELLYYLVNDRSPEVRREVAANGATPRQADVLLVRDADASVREGLADKIARLIPDLPDQQVEQVERSTVEILELLAQDQARTVRQILAEILKDLPNAPRGVITQLARDIELKVAGPVLRDSPILTDDDLLEIILGGPIDGALSAIAERTHVSERIADAIVTSADSAAIGALLANKSAQIREDTLDRILDHAPDYEPWHAPLVRRPRLPPAAVARLARFVADKLLHELSARTDLAPEALQAIAEVVETRLAAAGTGAADRPVPTAAATARNQRSPAPAPEPAPPATEPSATRPPQGEPAVAAGAASAGADGGAGTVPGAPAAADPSRRDDDTDDDDTDNGEAVETAAKETPLARARRLMSAGKLDERLLSQALAGGESGFTRAALAVLSGLDLSIVERIQNSHSPRAITALVWKAGLSMRFARQVQLQLARISPLRALNPRNGTDFPMTDKELRWQISFFADDK